MAGRRIDFDVVSEIGQTLPGVAEKVTSRGRALKVGGRLLACEAVHRSAEPGSLMIRIGDRERTSLLVADPEVFYLTDHYRDYPAALAQLAKAREEELAQLHGMGPNALRILRDGLRASGKSFRQ